MIRERTSSTPAPAGEPDRATLIATTLIEEAGAVGLVTTERSASQYRSGRLLAGTVFALVAGAIRSATPSSAGAAGYPPGAQEALTTSRLATLDLGPRLHGDAETGIAPYSGPRPARIGAGPAARECVGPRRDHEGGGLAVALLHTERSIQPPVPAPRPGCSGRSCGPRSERFRDPCRCRRRVPEWCGSRRGDPPALRRARGRPTTVVGVRLGAWRPEPRTLDRAAGRGRAVSLRSTSPGRCGDPSWIWPARWDDRPARAGLAGGRSRPGRLLPARLPAGRGSPRLDPELRALRALETPADRSRRERLGSGEGRRAGSGWLDRARPTRPIRPIELGGWSAAGRHPKTEVRGPGHPG